MRAAIALLLFVSAAVSAEDEDAPHRIAIERLNLSGDPIEVGACTTRLLGRSAKVTNYPVRDGVGLDWTPKAGLFFSAPGDPVISLEFRADEKGAFLVARYRHPYSADAARKIVAKAARKCFPREWSKANLN